MNNYYPNPSTIGPFDEGPTGRSRGVAGLLAIFLGSLGEIGRASCRERV